jgi:ubiquinone/menaquinone biosynthesis C-methylase UbiE
MTNRESVLKTTGQVINRPRFYELILWLVTRGKEKEFRKLTAELAGLKIGDSVLDVGCGTGTMALMAKNYIGKEGTIVGIEPSIEIINFAKHKAVREKKEIEFLPGIIENINFPNNSFDVVFCIVVLHHMPDEAKRQGIKEIYRVLKQDGRLLIIDSDLDLIPSIEQAGFEKKKSGRMPIIESYDYELWQKT